MESQTQLPVALHSVPVGHAWHATPPLPHDELLSAPYASHAPLLQQPLHALPPHVQAPLVHVELVAHAAHIAPPLPHELFDCPDWASHVPFAVQQPLGHDCALQTHWPVLLQVVPDAQMPQAVPPVPQEPPDCPE